MITAADPDIISATQSRTAIACFRDYADKFFIVAYSVPMYDVEFRPTKIEGWLQAYGTAIFSSYADGNSDDYRLVRGSWSKSKDDAIGEAMFESFKGPPQMMQVQITPSEIGLAFQFQNLANTTTSRTIQIRRSTLRYSDTLDAPDTVTPKGKASAKAPAPPPAAPVTTRTTFSGHCVKLN